MFANGELDIFLAMLEIRYMLTTFAFDIDMCHLLPHRAYRVAKQHIEPKAISSDTKWHISMLKLLFVETNNSFNMSRAREKIDGGDGAEGIAQGGEQGAVSCQGIGVAGDVHDALKASFC